MGARGRWALAVALVLGSVGAPAPAAAQGSVELARARQALEDYFACERTRRFAPCWPRLSKRVRAEWARQGRGSVAEYAESRGAAEPRYADFRVLQIRRSPSRVVFVVEATRASDRNGLPDRVEYAVLREGEQWKVDGRRVGPSETTP
ncbi:MAG TPA: hypothetical protein VK878_24835 [Candidatus Deferrimicrobiaceae bacterium]|nr:hypothetical protein [Candidatus Deferrimicrobiaceae bacterium]